MRVGALAVVRLGEQGGPSVRTGHDLTHAYHRVVRWAVGAPVGDNLLDLVLRQAVAQQDAQGRYGGPEFYFPPRACVVRGLGVVIERQQGRAAERPVGQPLVVADRAPRLAHPDQGFVLQPCARALHGRQQPGYARRRHQGVGVVVHAASPDQRQVGQVRGGREFADHSGGHILEQICEHVHVPRFQARREHAGLDRHFERRLGVVQGRDRLAALTVLLQRFDQMPLTCLETDLDSRPGVVLVHSGQVLSCGCEAVALHLPGDVGQRGAHFVEVHTRERVGADVRTSVRVQAVDVVVDLSACHIDGAACRTNDRQINVGIGSPSPPGARAEQQHLGIGQPGLQGRRHRQGAGVGSGAAGRPRDSDFGERSSVHAGQCTTNGSNGVGWNTSRPRPTWIHADVGERAPQMIVCGTGTASAAHMH